MLMISPRYLVLPYIAAAVGGCASSGGQRVYVAPTAETITSSFEETASHPGQVLYVENHSSVSVTVYSVTLRDCNNVKEPCEVRPLNLRLDPGNRVVIARVEPADPQKAYDFRSTFAWRADSAPKAALGALASAGDSGAQRELTLVRQAESRRRHEVGAQDLDLTPDEIESLADSAGSLLVIPDSLALHVGARIPMDTLRVLLMSKSNQPLGRVRSFRWRLPAHVVSFVPPDSLVAVSPGQTALQLRLSDDVLKSLPALHNVIEVPIVVQK